MRFLHLVVPWPLIHGGGEGSQWVIILYFYVVLKIKTVAVSKDVWSKACWIYVLWGVNENMLEAACYSLNDLFNL